jgi:hypothetical protein
VVAYGNRFPRRFRHENLNSRVRVSSFRGRSFCTGSDSSQRTGAGWQSRARLRKNCSSANSQPSLDFERVKSDADELLILSQSIHSGVDSVGKGMLPKDLIDKLKQMEKLSKRLRNELTP